MLKLLDRSKRLADDGIDGDELIITLKAMGKDLSPGHKDGSRDGFYLATFEGMIDTLKKDQLDLSDGSWPTTADALGRELNEVDCY